MGKYTVKRIDELESSFLGSYKRARAELGVSSFGMSVIELPPNIDAYPEHDHMHDGQEEVFVVLSGRATIEVDGDHIELDPDVMIRIAPEAKRKIATGEEPLRVLVLSGVPGGVYVPSENSKLGTPDPMAQPQS